MNSKSKANTKWNFSIGLLFLWLSFYGQNEPINTLQSTIVQTTKLSAKERALKRTQNKAKKKALLEHKITAFKTQIAKIDIPKSVEKEIFKEYSNYTQEVIKLKKDFKQRNEEELILFTTFSKAKSTLFKHLVSHIKLLLTYEQFSTLFTNQLQFKIKEQEIILFNELKNNNKNLKLTQSQEVSLRNLTYTFAQKKVLLQEYYSVRPQELKTQLLLHIKEAKKAYAQFLKKLELQNQRNIQYQQLEIRLKNASLSPATVSKFMHAVKSRDAALDKAAKIKQEIEQKYAVPIFDKTLKKGTINQKLKEKITQLITYDQFKNIFEEQLDPQINKQTQLTMRAVKKYLNLNQQQYNDIRLITLNFRSEESFINAYYHKRLAKKKVSVQHIKYKQALDSYIKKQKKEDKL